MLPPTVKAGIKKAAAKIASGEMKPGDTMVMADKPEMESDDKSDMFHSMATDMMECFENKDVEGLSALLEELCQHSKENY